MDRFIDSARSSIEKASSFLKSNMDRFIGYQITIANSAKTILKSNMDRFIECLPQM